MLKILRAPLCGKTYYDILSDKAFGVITHWIEKIQRNQPCTKPGYCCCDDDIVPTTWRAYLAVAEQRTGIVRLAEVTSEAWIEAGGVAVTERCHTLRGMILEMSRTKPHKSGRVVVRLLNPSAPRLWVLPPPPQVKDELERIWGSKL